MPNIEEENQNTHPTDAAVVFREPTIADGAAMWRLARDSQTLDLNSSYSYLLWSRDFARTSVLATVDGIPVGFISAYLRPDEPNTVMVWQVAVDHAYRGKRVALRMLVHLVGRFPTGSYVETTITSNNSASIALFMSFASSQGAPVDMRPIFSTTVFPDGHESEFLYRIGPLL